ncbi:hypothetical protein GCM10025759_32610 [Lysobacter panacisoli]|uniref:CAAX prenyl protease 2/Lysostaphin resistance protein A-like domain-containing protein n=2 Tax=Lysobacter panacisoli TaxID=1255263 RepID=A0ABP9LRY6_9GAMM
MVRSLCVIAALVVGAAQANEPARTAFTFGDGIAQVTEAKTRGYLDALAKYDAALSSAPDDVGTAVARCRFIGNYADEESGDWMPEATEAFESCSRQLHERWPDAPQALLFEFDTLWGEEAAARGDALIKTAGQWQASWRSELLTKTSYAHQQAGNNARAGELALMALRLGDASRLAAAVEYLSGLGKFDEAAEVLAKAEPAELPWEANERVEAALTLPDPKIALAELRRFPQAGEGVNVETAARAYIRAGDFASAQRVLKGAPGKSEAIKALKFDAAIGSRDFTTAVAQVDFTNTRNFTANLGRFAKLAVRAPLTLFTPSMMAGLLICAAWVMAVALAPGVVLVPAHYRGLARRLDGKVNAPLFPAVGLWRAWYAAAVAIVVPTVVALLVEPDAIVGMIEGKVTAAPQMFRAFLFGEMAALLLLLPALFGTNRRQLIGDRAALRIWWIVLLMWGALLCIGVVLTWLQTWLGAGGETAQTRMVAAMVEGGAEMGGPMLSLLILAFVGPVFEELAFRGLLLGGLSRHITFGWANVVQAALFAAIHDDPPRLPYYFAMGLFGGWLVRRTGSLGPAIALHVLNNAFAVGLLLWAR